MYKMVVYLFSEIHKRTGRLS